MKNQRTIVIAGGGTGGHIYPGLAIAKALQNQDAQLRVHFVGTALGLESKIVPREGFPLHLIRVGKLNHQGGLFSKLRTIFGLPRALLQSAALLLELKPELILGVGGYVSGPFVMMAALMGFRTAIWEPNAQPGLTNRWLSRLVDRSYVVFDDSKKDLHSKDIISIGLPVRQQIEQLAMSVTEQKQKEASFHVLVFGGSQGARAINKVMQELVGRDDGWRKNILIRHQTGRLDYEIISQAYHGVQGVEALEYIHDMEAQYRWADLVICRAGASTVAEIAAAKKPAIFVPLPTAADDHQTKNANSLKEQNAAVLLPQAELSADRLTEEIIKLKENPSRRQQMTEMLTQFYRPRAAERMAQMMLATGDQ